MEKMEASEKEKEKQQNNKESHQKFHPAESLEIAFSLYSRIPMPAREYSESGIRYSLCFFPCVGVVTGLCVFLVFVAANAVSLGNTAFCIIECVLPLIITGGIHMDGFLDVADALSSFAGTEKKWEIIKDPHVGAFAVIWAGIYLLLYVAAFSEIKAGAFPGIAGIYVLERALSGFSVVAFKKAEESSMAKNLSENSNGFAVKTAMVIWTFLALVFIAFTAGAAAAVISFTVSLLCLFFYYRLSMRQFKGINGDLAGFFLQLCELLLITVFAVVCS